MLGMLARGEVEKLGIGNVNFFEYGDTETEYLRQADPKLCELIDKVGHIDEYVDSDLYTSLVRNIIGQQISVPIYERNWARFQELFGLVPDPQKVLDAGVDVLRSMGIPMRRCEFILGISRGAIDGTILKSRFDEMDDAAAMKALDDIRGIGPWTAEMVMLFCLQRKNVFSYLDIALVRGIRRLYGKEVTPEFFAELKKRFSPYCSIASFYIWEVGEGRVPGYGD